MPNLTNRKKITLAALLIALSIMIDQFHKYYMIHISDLTERLFIPVLPFFDWVLVWNRGVSYGLFEADSDKGIYILVGITLTVIVGLFIMLARSSRYFDCLALSVVIGGALSNVIDRLHYGAVPDFFSFHIFGYRWYVFNIADIFITVGIVLLIIDSTLFSRRRYSDSSESS